MKKRRAIITVLAVIGLFLSGILYFRKVPPGHIEIELVRYDATVSSATVSLRVVGLYVQADCAGGDPYVRGSAIVEGVEVSFDNAGWRQDCFWSPGQRKEFTVKVPVGAEKVQFVFHYKGYTRIGNFLVGAYRSTDSPLLARSLAHSHRFVKVAEERTAVSKWFSVREADK